MGEATLKEAVRIARLALDVLTSEDRLVVNVTEWAKRESAWKRLASLRHDLSDEFLLECIPVKLNSVGKGPSQWVPASRQMSRSEGTFKTSVTALAVDPELPR